MSLISKTRSSRHLNQLDSSLQSYLGSKAFEEDMRTQAGYGRWKGVKASAGEKPIVLLPDNSYSTMKALFKSDYEKGVVPSKGYMHLKWCLVFLVSNVPHSTPGEVTLELRDPGVSVSDPLPGTQVCCKLSDLPMAVIMSTDYDMPLGKSKLKLGDREMRRMFFLHTKVSGFVGQGTAISMFPIWDCDFRSTCNNYVHVPVARYPISRLHRTDLLQCAQQLRQYAESTLLGQPIGLTGSSFAQPMLIDQNVRTKTSPSSLVEGQGSNGSLSEPSSDKNLSDENKVGTLPVPLLFNGVQVGAPAKTIP